MLGAHGAVKVTMLEYRHGDDASDLHDKSQRQPRETDPEAWSVDVGFERKMATPGRASGCGMTRRQ
jgi:hypothetical protein